MIGIAGHRPRVAGGFRQPDPLAPVFPGAGLPQGAKRLDGRLQLVQPDPGGRKGQAEPGVLARPPARPDAAERSSAAQGVQRGDRLGEDPRCAERDRCYQRAQAETGFQARQHPQRHPRLGDRLPGAADLGDLDQVIHQRDALQASLGGRAGHRGEPVRRAFRILVPEES